MPAPDDLAHWLRLAQTPGVGIDAARKLLSAFGLPQQIFAASLSALQTVVNSQMAQALLAPPSAELQAQITRTLEWAEQDDHHIYTLADAGYPAALLEIHDPPTLLYAKGRVDLLARPALAIVGSRNASAQGNSNARQFASTLSASGLTIISGLALGIDAAAHEGALQALQQDSAAGSTIAVIGTGADLVYPARNRALAHRIAAEGCIISEYPLGMPAIASNFPRRNRIISGLARGVLVVEAALQSGSLITARMAAEQGRDMFAIPGSIHSPMSKGCHLLIKQGAKLAESAQDILEELAYPVTVPTPRAASSVAVQYPHVLQQMGHDAVDIETLAQRCQLDMAALHMQLLALELDGHAEMLPGGLYRRII